MTSEVAKAELKSDLLSSGFLLVAADLADARCVEGCFHGPIIHDGRMFDIEATIKVRPAK